MTSRTPIAPDRSPWLALMVVATLATSVSAQSAPTIERVRIGLPVGGAGQDDGCTRNGAWAPVAVTLRGSKEGNPRGVYRLRVETTDLQEIAYQVTVAVPALTADGLRTITGYIVPGGDGATFRVKVETLEGQVVRTLAVPSRANERVVALEDILFFGAGAGLAQLRRAAEKLDRPDGKDPVADLDSGRRQVAHTNEVPLLPDRWIGYDAADVVVLMTGNRDFVLQLMQDDEAPRRASLVEWVRRGGQLVVSVGRNQQEVAKLLAKMPLLDCKVTGSDLNQKLPELSHGWCNRPPFKPILQQVELATLEVGDRVNVLVREERKPVIVQSSCGLGRVVLVAFDLDGPNFTGWDGQESFWTRLQTEIAPYLPPRKAGPGAVMKQPNPNGPPNMQGMGGVFDPTPSMQAELKRGVDTFEELPPISFGWVALFILFYIALVGPLDYFILKKLFKRLELTWVTFPLSVLIVSVAAYFTAYRLKGEELRINKIDLIEIDMSDSKQVYGSTWFSLFSPRVAAYTVGMEPASDTWTATPPAEAPGPILTLLEAGDNTLRAGSQSLFRRPYEYADEESGLRRVPIPVWSTRSFKASWRAPLQAKVPAIGITDDTGPIRLARNGDGLAGRITNNLPVRLEGVTLFYQHRWYFLDTLEPGEQKRIEPLFAGDAQGQNQEIREWVNGPVLTPKLPLAPTGRPLSTGFQARPSFAFNLFKRMLFFRDTNPSISTNAGLRRYDQTWRLRALPQYPDPHRPRFRDEVMLVARTPMVCDEAEAVTTHGASPSRLWLGELPQADLARPVVPGIMTQETYLRVFIPVQK